MMKNTFFSVSMPVHNAAKYLEEAIRSVLNQDYDRFELILVDDHSVDESPAICEAWRKKHPEKIKVVASELKGSLWARRECIHHSAGDFLFVMDSDDTLCDPEALKKWDEVIRRTDCDLLIFKETEETKPLFRNWPEDAVIEGPDRVLLYEEFAAMGDLNPLWNKTFRRDLIDPDDTPYRQHAWLSHGTDFYQSIAVVSAAKRVALLDRKCYDYRVTPGSITHRYNPEMFRTALALIERRRELAATWSPQPPDLEQKLKACALQEFCTVLNKLRRTDLPFPEKQKIYEAIRLSAPFREGVSEKRRLPAAKRTIVSLLQAKQYRLLDRLLSLAP
ncbi:MAG: glycosyltransferase family 2 protein [Clostridiales bacterium]|nr:glycosyltransferase family 2 protein [Clostridiales bacterium]